MHYTVNFMIYINILIFCVCVCHQLIVGSQDEHPVISKSS